ncbi:hypothetical protein BC628DRAFT_1348513 [Trametes gibbosa]|nr:hypothetical protein BC628DRAFT_1348513 [Trametes gibbosa]
MERQDHNAAFYWGLLHFMRMVAFGPSYRLRSTRPSLAVSGLPRYQVSGCTPTRRLQSVAAFRGSTTYVSVDTVRGGDNETTRHWAGLGKFCRDEDEGSPTLVEGFYSGLSGGGRRRASEPPAARLRQGPQAAAYEGPSASSAAVALRCCRSLCQCSSLSASQGKPELRLHEPVSLIPEQCRPRWDQPIGGRGTLLQRGEKVEKVKLKLKKRVCGSQGCFCCIRETRCRVSTIAACQCV